LNQGHFAKTKFLLGYIRSDHAVHPLQGRGIMKNNLVLLVLSLMACAMLMIGCDSSGSISLGSKNPTDPETSVEPGPKILPYTSPRDGDGMDDPGGGDDPTDKNDGSGDQMPVPEPSTLVLVGSGIAIISLCKRRKRNAKNL
jgi:hypothetical protein